MDRHVNRIAEDLAALGVESGDCILAMADVRFLRFDRNRGERINPANALRDGILGAIGAEGTVMAMTFSSAVTYRWLPRSMSCPPEVNITTGSFAKSILAHPASVRSQHPTSSFSAIGPFAAELTRFHTPHAHSFRPVEDLIACGGKLLKVGCTEVNPGFATVHVAQFHLGLSALDKRAGKVRVRYTNEYGRNSTFIKYDIPGCGGGFGKQYPIYENQGILSSGSVAGAKSMLVPARAAYELDRQRLKDNPASVLCDNPLCWDCNVGRPYTTSSRIVSSIRINAWLWGRRAQRVTRRFKEGGLNFR